MIHIDLFSGIGGFALAARWAGIETVQFVEIDPFCQKVLAKNFPGIPIHDDIKTFTYASPIKNDERERGNMGNQTEGGEGGNAPAIIGNQYGQRPFLLTGGFPCQPFSCAGKRRGKADDRYLWPEMLRVVSEAKPTWVIGENVAGIESIFQYDSFSELEGKEYLTPEDAETDFNGICERTGTNTLWMVLEDLKKIGYKVQPFVIPACAKNAPHRRDRVWIVAHSKSVRCGGGTSERWEIADRVRRNEMGVESQRQDRHAPDTEGRETQPPEPGGFHAKPCGTDSDVTNTQDERLQRGSNGHEGINQGESRLFSAGSAWNEPWLEAATRLCRVDDGLPRQVDRVKRLKALGNSIVPQVAYEIMKVIKRETVKG